MAVRVSMVAEPRCGTSTACPELEELGVDLGLILEDVEAGAGDRAVPQRSGERRLVDDRPARRVDEVRGAFMAVSCSAPIRWCVGA